MIGDGSISSALDNTGVIALVTGGGSGIGRATAILLAARGATVIVADLSAPAARETVELIVACGGSGVACEVDVSDSASVDALFAEVATRFDRLDIAVNSAGISGRTQGFTNQGESEFDAIIGVNLKGVWLCMQREITMFGMQGGGAIVNVASALGLVGAETKPAYSATKHAVIGLTRSAAIEHSRHGIRVNAVCPGVIRTPLMDKAGLSADFAASLVKLHPIGRLGTAEEVAEAICWLSSPAASFVTGAALAVDGGWTAA